MHPLLLSILLLPLCGSILKGIALLALQGSQQEDKGRSMGKVATEAGSLLAV